MGKRQDGESTFVLLWDAGDKKPAQWRAQFATRSGAGRPQISRSYRSVQAVQAVQVDACEG